MLSITGAGHRRITQDNGFVVDVSMEQTGQALGALCTHSNGRVRSTKAVGAVNGDSMKLTITWDNGSKGEYTGRLEKGLFTKVMKEFSKAGPGI